MKLEYYRKGDYFFPNLKIESIGASTGKYGMLRRTFLKGHRSGWYQSMLLTGKLDRHLQETEIAASERMGELFADLSEKYPAPDKGADQLGWVAHRNMIMSMVEEIVMDELIYK